MRIFLEGWHDRLNQSACGAKLPMYSLIQLLFDESTKVSLQVRMLSENKISANKRESTENFKVNSSATGTHL